MKLFDVTVVLSSLWFVCLIIDWSVYFVVFCLILYLYLGDMKCKYVSYDISLA